MTGEPVVGLADVDELRALLDLLRRPVGVDHRDRHRDPRNSCLSLVSAVRIAGEQRRTDGGHHPAQLGEMQTGELAQPARSERGQA